MPLIIENNLVKDSIKNLKSDLLIFEKKYLFKGTNVTCSVIEQLDLYYKILDQSEILLIIKQWQIIIDNNPKIIKEFGTNFKNIESAINLDFKNFLYLNSLTEILLNYVFIFFLKTYINVSFKVHKKRRKEIETEKIYLNYSFSEDCIVNLMLKELEKLIIWLKFKNQNVSFFFDKKKIRLSIIKVLRVIESEGTFFIKNCKFSNFKTLKIYIFKNRFNLNYFNVEIYFSKFTVFNLDSETFILNNHFSTIEKIFKKNKKSNKEFELGENGQILTNLCNIWVYLDKKALEEIYLAELGFHSINGATIEKNYEDLLYEHSIAIKNDDLFLLKHISKHMSIYQNLLKIKKILALNLEQKIYFPFDFDFRGRVYLLSDVSPTFDTRMRYCLHKGIFETDDIKEHFLNNIILQELSKYIYMIDECPLFNFKHKEKKIKITVIWLLISLGEIQKIELCPYAHIQKIIEIGIKSLQEKNVYKDLKDQHKFTAIKNILKELEKGIYKKWLISKDATASCYQHLIKILGPKNNEALSYCNLQSNDTFYDPYSFIIKNFIEEHKNTFNYLTSVNIDKIFNRKTLKRVIMTHNYGVTQETAYKYFIEQLPLDLFSAEQKNEINTFFKKFFKSLTEGNIIFLHSPQTIISFFKDNPIVVYNDKSTTDLNYFKGKTTQINFYLNGNRNTKKEESLTNKIDLKKFKTSIRANYVQSIDAALVRWYLESESEITIHDCFMIDIFNITFAVSKINEGMRIVFHDLNLEKVINTDNFFSIFIII